MLIQLAKTIRVFAFVLCALSAWLSGCNHESNSATKFEQEVEPRKQEPSDLSKSVATQRQDAVEETEIPQPRSNEIIFAEAMELYQQNNAAAALRLLKELLAADSQNWDATFLASRIYADSGDLETAVSMLDDIPSDAGFAGSAALGQ